MSTVSNLGLTQDKFLTKLFKYFLNQFKIQYLAYITND